MSMQELKEGVAAAQGLKDLVKERAAVAAKTRVALGVFPPRFKGGQTTQTLSMFVIDGKAVAWEDAVKLAIARGWKWRIIGVEDGEYGVDLCDGKGPAAIVAMISDAQEQMDGGGQESNPIFKKMALEIIRAVFNLLRCYELTPDGKAEVARRKERLYSFAHVQDVAQSVLEADGRLFKIVDAINRAAVNPIAGKAIAKLVTSDLWSDIKFLRKDLPNRPADTVTSFLLNVHKMLSGTVSDPVIRKRFGAAGGNMLEIDDIWDDKTVTCFRLSFQTDIGDTAKLIGIMTLASIFARGGVRQLVQKDIGDVAKLAFVIDEMQEIVVSGYWGLANVTAMSRSWGFSFACATQGVKGIIKRIGDDATWQLINNLRTKIFTQTEAKEDQDIIIRLGGEAWRSLSTARGEFENYHQRLRIERGHMDESIRPLPVDSVDYTLSTSDVFGAPQRVEARSHEVVRLDKHGMMGDLQELAHASKFVSQADAQAGRDMAAEASAEYQAKRIELEMRNRQEDQLRTYYGGWEKKPLYTINDVSSLGMGQAIVFINRAGVLRTDKVDVNPDLAKMPVDRDIIIDVQAREVGNVPMEQIAQASSTAVLANRAQAKQPVAR
ncbi:TraM recognition domain-containing protein [Scleromatobacter humisilvae]|uniref:TraD/TraG TraM recognition site domain-containing protein n=1 Tax=Scleromatobacter humisilvae TaxID=2897159 RepID=A0A9X1YM75_9BURK|nr:hypothetical protein [Scleromatobacter humisilvae]MCK9687298.1 hypothetical protein [Scleromatobacter humisilvae]